MTVKRAKDPFFGLKYIAYLRTGLPADDLELDDETLISFAKWQVCKIRNILWNDPVWNEYTSHEILIEYFSIKFDENNDLRKEFEAGLITIKDADVEWLERMASAYEGTKEGKIEGGEVAENPVKIPEEFEETF